MEPEIQEYLKGSIKIPEAMWRSLPEGSEISYFRKDSKFVKRAFVKIFYVSKKGDNYAVCSNKLHKFVGDTYYNEYHLKLDKVESIYKRVSQDSVVEYKLIKAKLEASIEELESKVDALSERLVEEAEKTKTLAKLVKQLYSSFQKK
jgi:ElaB/YqjD/DUF883 family membrane-anchored ribosome-binding protein